MEYNDIFNLLLEESAGDISWQLDVKSLSRAFLHASIMHDDVDLMEELLSRGAEVNETDRKGRTPLMNASQGDDITRVRFLLNAKADVNACPEGRCMALSFACERGHLDIVHLLIDAGADVTAVTKKGRNFPLLLFSYLKN